MYLFIRDATFRSSADGFRGIQIAVQIVKHYKDSHNIDLRLLRPMDGSPNQLRFVTELTSIDAWVERQKVLAEDAVFLKLLEELATTVDGTKTLDEFWH